MIVTTVYDPSPDTETKARGLAERLAAGFVPRRQFSIARLRSRYGQQPVWIVSEKELKYVTMNDAVLFFHPSTAIIRVKRMLKGESDTVVRLAGIRPGDSVIDCTAGLASDSIVFSHAAGAEGRVVALESQLVIGTLISEGLHGYVSDLPELNEAMRRVEVCRTPHLEYLLAQPDRSADTVYFDPMFRDPIGESSSMSPLRGTANDDPLTIEAISQAMRVARHTVVLKEHRDSTEFARLGFTTVHRTSSKIAYGVITLDSAANQT
ncbi:class I SAM-dependent methyltransferase [Paenibacillus gansuensis]|uniref:Class I SAM-dependent methyltransferase n=1 Tax=Paenibacillus gansuensis TaxID=306542 RepID=A0ABW5PA98_9BACL